MIQGSGGDVFDDYACANNTKAFPAGEGGILRPDRILIASVCKMTDEVHHTDALSRGSSPPLLLFVISPPRGDQNFLVLWDRRHKTDLSGFMGISSVGYAATFSSGEGFLRASVSPLIRLGENAIL